MTLEGGAAVGCQGASTPFGPETSGNGDWELLGERGRLRWTGGAADSLGGRVLLDPPGGPAGPLAPAEEGVEDRAAVLATFQIGVETGQEPETGAVDDLRTLAALLGRVRSRETGEVVDVPAMPGAAGSAGTLGKGWASAASPRPSALRRPGG